MKAIKQILIFISILAFPYILYSESVRVGIAGSNPFKIQKENEINGISLEIWKEVALNSKLTYTITSYKTMSELISATEKGEIDVGIGPITITSHRAEKVHFTQPYYASHPGILAKEDSLSLFNLLKPFFQRTFFYGLIALLSTFFIVANLVRWVEKKTNPKFQTSYWKGIGNGMWLSIVTFSTVGYGDITPLTKSGRVIIGTWMIVGMITASSLTAGIATSFTLLNLSHASIESAESLRNRNVAAIKGSTGVDFVKNYQGKLVVSENLEEAINLFKNKRVDAVVTDYPILKYYTVKNPIEKTKVIEVHSEQDNYGFCTSLTNPILYIINKSLLEVIEKGKVNEILTNWNIL